MNRFADVKTYFTRANIEDQELRFNDVPYTTLDQELVRSHPVSPIFNVDTYAKSKGSAALYIIVALAILTMGAVHSFVDTSPQEKKDLIGYYSVLLGAFGLSGSLLYLKRNKIELEHARNPGQVSIIEAPFVIINNAIMLRSLKGRDKKP